MEYDYHGSDILSYAMETSGILSAPENMAPEDPGRTLTTPPITPEFLVEIGRQEAELELGGNEPLVPINELPPTGSHNGPPGSFRQNIGRISKHAWPKGELRFYCHWEGFDAITWEPVEEAMKAVGPLTEYLKGVSKRGKTTLLKRCEVLGQFYKL